MPIIRRVFAVLSLVSLLLCIATLALWTRSYWRRDVVSQYVARKTVSQDISGECWWESNCGTLRLSRLVQVTSDPAVLNDAMPLGTHDSTGYIVFDPVRSRSLRGQIKRQANRSGGAALERTGSRNVLRRGNRRNREFFDGFSGVLEYSPAGATQMRAQMCKSGSNSGRRLPCARADL
jgi:hypothetical protein